MALQLPEAVGPVDVPPKPFATYRGTLALLVDCLLSIGQP
jgi:hypothetical protein